MELVFNNLIKIILGILVFVVVTLAVYLFFKEQVIDFFDNFISEPAKFFLGLK